MELSRRDLLVTASSLAAASISTGCTSTRPFAPPLLGLDFPGSAAVKATMRFRFSRPLAIYPATYIWRAFPRRQRGYYTAFFWGNDDGQNDLRTFLWAPNQTADSYYGAHPYPQPPPRGEDHRWEISVLQKDLLGREVEYDRWYTQALRVWSSGRGKHHEYFWNLPSTEQWHRVSFTAPATWGNRQPPVPSLTWGDAPWAPGNEVWNGVLSGIQIYSTCLSVADILSEATASKSTFQGRSSMWYENLEPRPDDIRDKSGRGNHPQWVGAERPSLWTRPVQTTA